MKATGEAPRGNAEGTPDRQWDAAVRAREAQAVVYDTSEGPMTVADLHRRGGKRVLKSTIRSRLQSGERDVGVLLALARRGRR